MCDKRPYHLLLGATIAVISDHSPHSLSLAVAFTEACEAKKRSQARRAIIPQWALRPVCRSSRSRERSSLATSVSGSRTLTIVEGPPLGRPPGFLAVVVSLDDGVGSRRPPTGQRGVTGICGISM
jgi:hypothetical protein